MPIALHCASQVHRVELLGDTGCDDARCDGTNQRTLPGMRRDNRSELFFESCNDMSTNVCESILFFDAEQQGDSFRIGRRSEHFWNACQARALHSGSQCRDGLSWKWFDESIDGVERKLDFSPRVARVTRQCPVTARKIASGSRSFRGMDDRSTFFGGFRWIAWNEKHSALVDESDREAGKGTMRGDGSKGGGRIVGSIGASSRRRGAHENERTAALALEEGCDLLLETSTCEQTRRRVNGSSRNCGRHVTTIDHGGAHAAYLDKRPMYQRCFFGAIERARSNLHGYAAFGAPQKPPPNAIVAQRGREPRRDVRINELITLVTNTIDTAQTKNSDGLETKFEQVSVAGLDTKPIGGIDLAAPKRERRRRTEPHGGATHRVRAQLCCG